MNLPAMNYNADLPIDVLTTQTMKSLISSLKESEGWKMLAESFGVFSQDDIDRIAEKASPATHLMNELRSHLCTVGILVDRLRFCKLNMALYAVCGPEPLVIIKQPGQNADNPDEGRDQMMTIPYGCTLRLECKATGLPPPIYAWFQDNEELLDQTREVLEIKEFGLEHCGEYCCRVSQRLLHEGRVIEITSESVEVDLMPQLPEITEQPQSVVCREGSSIVLTFSIAGTPAIGDVHFQWFKSNQSLPGCTTNYLEIESVSMSDEGLYRCYIVNKAGELWTEAAKLTMVYRPPDSFMAKEKFALLIGNDEYINHSSLKIASSDVATLTKIFENLRFKVVALKNLTLKEMRNALKKFCKMLPYGAYALFYFAGHGFEIQDKYMLPIDAPGSGCYLRSDSLCEREVIKEVYETHPRLVVIILDMCLRVPDSKENPGIHKEVPPVYEFKPGQRNLVRGYATTSNLGAYERSSETNGIYAKHLAKALSSFPDLPIVKVLEKVNEGVSNEAPDAAEKQMPCVSHNLAFDFCLSGDVEGDAEASEKYAELTALPTSNGIPLEIVFQNVKLRTKVVLSPHLDTFLNSLDVLLIGLQGWNVEFHVPNLELQLESTQQPDGCMVTIHNLQRLKVALFLTVRLKDARNMMVDHAILDLQCAQLIQVWQLWHPE